MLQLATIRCRDHYIQEHDYNTSLSLCKQVVNYIKKYLSNQQYCLQNEVRFVLCFSSRALSLQISCIGVALFMKRLLSLMTFYWRKGFTEYEPRMQENHHFSPIELLEVSELKEKWLSSNSKYPYVEVSRKL